MGLNNKIKDIENMFWYSMFEAMTNIGKWCYKQAEEGYIKQVEGKK